MTFEKWVFSCLRHQEANSTTTTHQHHHQSVAHHPCWRSLFFLSVWGLCAWLSFLQLCLSQLNRSHWLIANCNFFFKKASLSVALDQCLVFCGCVGANFCSIILMCYTTELVCCVHRFQWSAHSLSQHFTDFLFSYIFILIQYKLIIRQISLRNVQPGYQCNWKGTFF